MREEESQGDRREGGAYWREGQLRLYGERPQVGLARRDDLLVVDHLRSNSGWLSSISAAAATRLANVNKKPNSCQIRKVYAEIPWA